MGVIWTEEQQKVISLRDRNILVSAAAGSGKTAASFGGFYGKSTDAGKYYGESVCVCNISRDSVRSR